MYKWKMVFIGCLVLLSVSLVFAEGPSFQNSENEILQELSKKPAKTRSFVPVVKKQDVTVMEQQANEIVEKSVTIYEDDGSPRVNLRIEFDHDSYTINENSFPLLNELGKALCNDALKDKIIIINGHADADGEDQYNLQLSLNRAVSIKNYLLSNFPLEAESFRTIGYGESAPLLPNDSSGNKQKNRRVEITLKSD